MAGHMAKLFTLAKLANPKVLTNNARILGYYSSKRYVQEFPEMKMNNAQPKDYILVLPEPLNEDPNSNEVLRLPKKGQPELDYSKLNAEMVFKGLSQLLCTYENYLTDFNNQECLPNKPVGEFLKELEQNLYPLDSGFNVLIMLLNVDTKNYRYKELVQLIERYYVSREGRLNGHFKEAIKNYVLTQHKDMSAAEKKMIKFYSRDNPNHAKLRPLEEGYVENFTKHLKTECDLFRAHLRGANQLFSHTIDDPDVLAVVTPEFEDCENLHHKERTPLKVTASTYQKFMRFCPDRFIRQMVWETRNKRCSPKALPKYNNVNVISNIRVLRRKLADQLGFRTHVELRLNECMVKTRQQVTNNLKTVQEYNTPTLSERLYELNDYAADNQFEDTNQSGIQEYDVDFWTHKYKYEVLIGRSESEIKTYFPLPTVIKGIENYFKNCMGIEIQRKSKESTKLWNSDVELLEVTRNNEPLGTILLDPYQNVNKQYAELFYARIRGRSDLFGCLPSRLISTSFRRNKETNRAHLGIDDIINLFYCYATVIQRLMYKYQYYELNTYGGFELDVNNLFPNLCIAHLLNDHRILQSCSDRGASKPIDSELASRILKATNHFKSFKTSRDLYMAHLDLEAHSSLSDTKNIVEEIYPQYNPFAHNKDNYEFCALEQIFVGPNDGVQYSELWCRQLANFCLAQMLSQTSKSELSSIDFQNIRSFNSKLLDTLFIPDNFDTQAKLTSLFGRSLEPSETSLSML